MMGLCLLESHFPLVNNFRASAHQALGKTFKRGRLQKIGSKYRLNPEWSGGTVSVGATILFPYVAFSC